MYHELFIVCYAHRIFHFMLIFLPVICPFSCGKAKFYFNANGFVSIIHILCVRLTLQFSLSLSLCSSAAARKSLIMMSAYYHCAMRVSGATKWMYWIFITFFIMFSLRSIWNRNCLTLFGLRSIVRGCNHFSLYLTK